MKIVGFSVEKLCKNITEENVLECFENFASRQTSNQPFSLEGFLKHFPKNFDARDRERYELQKFP